MLTLERSLVRAVDVSVQVRLDFLDKDVLRLRSLFSRHLGKVRLDDVVVVLLDHTTVWLASIADKYRVIKLC